MIVCVCKNISDKTLAELKDQGLALKQIVAKVKLGTKCGKCVRYLKEKDK